MTYDNITLYRHVVYKKYNGTTICVETTFLKLFSSVQPVQQEGWPGGISYLDDMVF